MELIGPESIRLVNSYGFKQFKRGHTVTLLPWQGGPVALDVGIVERSGGQGSRCKPYIPAIRLFVCLFDSVISSNTYELLSQNSLLYRVNLKPARVVTGSSPPTERPQSGNLSTMARHGSWRVVCVYSGFLATTDMKTGVLVFEFVRVLCMCIPVFLSRCLSSGGGPL